SNEKVRKRLGRFIKTKLEGQATPTGVTSGSGSGRVGRAGHSGGESPGTGGVKGSVHPSGPTSPRDTSDAHLPNVPTAIAFESKVMRVQRGRSSYVWVDIDAKNGYLPDNDDDLTLTILSVGEGQSPLVASRSKLLGGRSRWTIFAPESVEEGE